MARPRTRTTATTTTLTIWLYPDQASGTCVYHGDAKYVTTTGHIVLFGAKRTVHITMAIQTAGYTFNPVNPIIISENIANKSVPGAVPNNFSAPVLSAGNVQLDFDDDNHGNRHYYYTLNFIGPNGPFSVDPIILNN
jgi:hypothetical protein